MDLGTLYGFVSALGTLIGAIDHLVATIKTRGVTVSPHVDAAIGQLKDGHASLAQAVRP